MDPQQVEFLNKVEQFGQEALKVYAAMSLSLGLSKPEDHKIIMEALAQKAEQKLLTEIQKHLDDHHAKNEVCREMDEIKRGWEIKVEPSGRVVVLRRKDETGGLN